MDINAFLAEVFCVESPKTDLANIMGKIFKGGTQLDLNWILGSTRVLSLLYLNETCRALFGFQIPEHFGRQILAPIDPQSEGFTPYVASTLFNRFTNSIFKLNNIPVTDQTALKYTQTLITKPQEAKTALIKWLCRGVTLPSDTPLPSSLIEAFKLQAPKKIVGILQNAITGNMIVEHPLALTLIPYDIKVTVALHDSCMQRQLLTCQPVVILRDTGALQAPLLEAIYQAPENPKKLLLITIKSVSKPPVDFKLAYTHFELESLAELEFLPAYLLQLVYYIGTPPPNTPNLSLHKQVVVAFDGEDLNALPKTAITLPFTETPQPSLYIPYRGDIPLPITMAFFKIFMNPKAQHWVYQRLCDMLLNNYIPVMPPKSTPHCVLLVDNRANGLSVLAVLLTLSNLDRTKWTPVVYTREEHREFYTKSIPGVVVHTHPLLEVTNFDIETCNTLMKECGFWTKLGGFEKCLIVQDDGMLLRKGLESSEFMMYDYVGAPWKECPENRELTTLTGMVGNGGFCLRTVCACVDITQTAEATKTLLFNNRLQQIQEDVWFAKELATKGYKVCPADKAKDFSVEQVFNTMPFGFHKIWAYHPPEKIQEFFKSYATTTSSA